MTLIKFERCYIMRHAERFDRRHRLRWWAKYLTTRNLKLGDTPITEQGYQQAYHRAEKIYEDGFIPDVIYASPYTRCRQTADAVRALYQDKGHLVPVVISNLLGEVQFSERGWRSKRLALRIRTIYNEVINIGRFKNLFLVTHARILSDLAHAMYIPRPTVPSRGPMAWFLRYWSSRMPYLELCTLINKNGTLSVTRSGPKKLIKLRDRVPVPRHRAPTPTPDADSINADTDNGRTRGSHLPIPDPESQQVALRTDHLQPPHQGPSA